MQEKSAREVNEMIKANPILKIIDVREQWEYDKCHIENSTHIPMGKIPDSLELFNDSHDYVIVCHHGIRSRTVALYLEQKGIKAKLYNLSGGIEQWSDDVDSSIDKYK
jgi:rhodanese-related sulfurtransferase|tara:strand:+ start:232 stop:555 length:324 start_codon:yes stop_codon:yes gene_type:complete